LVALPCFHLLRRTFPGAEIILLTNLPATDQIVPAEAVLRGTGLVDRYIRYPGGTRDIRHLRALRREIRSLALDALIYLAEPRGAVSLYRDYLFFRLCGVRRILGLDPLGIQVKPLWPIAGSAMQEAEGQRLGRQLYSIGSIDFHAESYWNLQLSSTETEEAARIVEEAFPPPPRRWERRLLGLSIGTKQTINDWGDANWQSVVEALGGFEFGLIMVGGPEDRARSQALADRWPGPALNVCGSVSPRVTAAVLQHVRLFLCHDSGPMHLAAAVGTPCVAVFSRRNPPGKWFPFGVGHTVLYPTAKSGSIASIRPRQVVAAVVDALGARENVRLSSNLSLAG